METKFFVFEDISKIAELPTIVESLAEELHLSSDVQFNINLALEEALANIFSYAYPENESKEAILQIKQYENQLFFILTDSGVEFDPTKEDDVDITLPAEERKIGGLGIFLIKNIMNHVSYQRIDDKNILTMELDV